MYLGVMIDSEHYTDVTCVFRETLNEVMCTLESIAFEDDYGEVNWADDFYLCEGRKVKRGITNGDDYWLVMEIFEVEDNNIYLIQWHAYEGVDFDVAEFDNWDSAYNTMKYKYHGMIEDWEIDTNRNQCYIDSYSCVIDDDNEWHMMEIVTKGE